MKAKIYLALIILLGIALRFWHNLDISLWHDEAFSALLIKYSWGEMFYRIGLDVHPPFYYVLLRLWHDVWGDSLLALRSFSVTFGLATILLSYLLAKQVFASNKAALWAAAFVALNPFQIQYATEARMYTLGGFLGVLGAWLALKALNAQGHARLLLPEEVTNKSKFGPTFWYAMFGLTLGAMALTHYYLLFTALALFATCLLTLIFRYRQNLFAYKGLLLSAILALLTFLPWIKWFLYQVKQVGSGYWIPQPNFWSVPTTLWQLMFGVGSDTSILSNQILLIALTLFVVFLLFTLLYRLRSSGGLLVTAGLLAPFLGSLAFLILAKLQHSNSSVYLVRYFIFASPFLLLALAFWVGQIKHRLGQLLLGFCILGIFLFSLWHYFTEIKFEDKRGMKALASQLTQSYSPGNAVYAGTSFEFFNLKYYQAQQGRVWPLPKLYSGGNVTTEAMPHFAGTAILTNEELLPEWNSEVKSGDTAFVVWTTGFGATKPEVPSNWQETQEWGFQDVRPYPGVWVVLTKYEVK